MVEPVKVTRHIPLSSMPDDQVPLKELKHRFEVRKEFNFWNLEQDCRLFAEMIITWRDKELYKHFFDSWEDFLRDYIGKPQEWVDNIVEGVKLLDQSRPIAANDALEAAIAKAKEKPLTHNGGDRKSDDYNRSDNIKLISKKGGTSREYLAARLSRDCPEVLGEIGKAKKYKSVRAAAIAVGIVKPKVTIQFPPEESGSQIAGRLYQKLNDDQLIELREALNEFFGG